MYSHPASHPLDTDLLDFVEDALDDAASRAVETHLASCLLCRIKRQRLTGVAPIEFTDVRDVRVPEFGAIEIEDVPGTAARRGELWLTASDEATMVLVRTVRDNDYGVVVVPVTLDVEVADSGALILDTSASPLAVPIVIYDRLAVSLPSSALSGRVMPLRAGLTYLRWWPANRGFRGGPPWKGPPTRGWRFASTCPTAWSRWTPTSPMRAVTTRLRSTLTTVLLPCETGSSFGVARAVR